MKLLLKPLIAASLVLGLFGISMAQTTAPTPAQRPAHSMAKMHASMQARHAQGLADLRSKLKLEAGQDNAWLNFTQAMQMPMPPATRPDRVAMEKLTTPERLDLMQTHKAQHDAQMLKRTDATKTFYATLSPEQKKVFDSETSKFMKSMGYRMHNAKHGKHDSGHHSGHYSSHH